jgi:hypothetical protein
MGLLRFFTDTFRKMPKWVRVTTWFALLILSFYLYVTPRFINGQMVAVLPNGGTIEYRGATLRTHIEGRVLKFKTNEDGYWSVPLVSRLPLHKVRLQVYHEDARAWYDVEIDGKTVWNAGMGLGEIRLEVKNDPPSVKHTVIAGSAGFPQAVFGALARSGAPAWAGQTSPGPAQAGKTEIARKLYAIIAEAAGKARSSVGPAFRLTGRDAPAYAQKLRIISETEHAFDIKIPDEEWRAMSTAGDLADFIYRELEKGRP